MQKSIVNNNYSSESSKGIRLGKLTKDGIRFLFFNQVYEIGVDDFG